MIACVLPVCAAGDIIITTLSDGEWARLQDEDGTSYYPFNSFPATFGYFEMGTEPYFYVAGNTVLTETGAEVFFEAGQYIEFMFNTGSGSIDISYSLGYPEFTCGVRQTIRSNDREYFFSPRAADLQLSLLVDDTLIQSVDGDDFTFNYSGEVQDYFSIRIVCDSDSSTTTGDFYSDYAGYVQMPYPIFTFNGQGDSTSSDLTIIQGQLNGIRSELVNINTNVGEVLTNVKDIGSTVKQTSDQLKDPNSPIWDAAKSAIYDSFVPSAEDIEEVKQGFDDLAQEKLGGAYTAMETVDDTFTQLNDKLNRPSEAAGFEFPGISVPLGGEIGTVELVPAQLVAMPLEVKDTLHPICAIIIPIICGIGTFNSLKDMVECFLSGYSYAEYLHRDKGGSD